MPIEILESHLNGLVVLRPSVFQDHRGFFLESFRADEFARAGLPVEFAQDNHSGSIQGVLRGLHFQWDPPMAKLMRVTAGEAFLVAVDIRKGSPTLGHWYGTLVSDANRLQIYAPAGFARGFYTTSGRVEIQYKCTGIYNSKCEGGILWNDPAIGITWPEGERILSDKDKLQPTLEQWLARPESDHFRFGTL